MNLDITHMPSLIALGGIAAIVATGWQHIKAAFNHISALLIVRAYADPSISIAVSNILRRDWKLMPSATIEYHGMWLKLRGHSTTTLVPFKMPPYSSAVYYRRREAVLFSHDKGQLTSLRGLANLDNLVCQAVEFQTNQHHARMRERDSVRSRFQVYNVIGEEKGAWSAAAAFAKHRGGDNNNSIRNLSDAPDSQAAAREPNPQVDKILLYSVDDLSTNDAVDPFSNLFYEQNVMDAVEDIKKWYSMGDWYNERNIPWRRGLQLSGPPGSGKSTLTQATAECLGIPLYVFHLATLSNQEFISHWQTLNSPCAIVFEDFDAVFHGREPQTEHKSLTFDCVLNQISGVQNKGGLLLFVNTNLPEFIDPALGNFSDLDTGDLGIKVSTRPGRLDVAIHIGTMSKVNRLKLAQKTLRDWPELVERVMAVDGEFTPVQFEEICLQMAMRRLREENGTTRTPENHVEIIKDTP